MAKSLKLDIPLIDGGTMLRHPKDDSRVAGAVKAPECELEAKESKAELHAGLKKLKAADRATLEAFYLRGQSLVEMSAEFEAPVGTIKRRLHVARHRLKEILGGDSGAESPRALAV